MSAQVSSAARCDSWLWQFVQVRLAGQAVLQESVHMHDFEQQIICGQKTRRIEAMILVSCFMKPDSVFNSAEIDAVQPLLWTSHTDQKKRQSGA